jgi:hypothetical protein
MWGALPDESVVYNCCWSSPVQSFSGPSPTEFMTIFYSLRFKTPPNLVGHFHIFILPRNRVAQLYPRHCVPFSSPPTTHRATVEVFAPASTQRLT